MAEAIIDRAHVPHLLHFHFCSNEAQVLERCEHSHYYLRLVCLLMPKTSLIVTQCLWYYLEIIWFVAFLSFFFFLVFVVNNDVIIVLRCGLRLTESINKAFKHFIYWMGLLFLMQRRMWGKMKLGLAWRESQISCFGFGWRKCFQHDVHTLATNWKQAARNYPWWC